MQPTKRVRSHRPKRILRNKQHLYMLHRKVPVRTSAPGARCERALARCTIQSCCLFFPAYSLPCIVSKQPRVSRARVPKQGGGRQKGATSNTQPLRSMPTASLPKRGHFWQRRNELGTRWKAAGARTRQARGSFRERTAFFAAAALPQVLAERAPATLLAVAAPAPVLAEGASPAVFTPAGRPAVRAIVLALQVAARLRVAVGRPGSQGRALGHRRSGPERSALPPLRTAPLLFTH